MKKEQPLWRLAEEKIYKAFREAGFYVETFIDTRVAGNFVQATTSDALVAKNGVAAFMEVKSMEIKQGQNKGYSRGDLTLKQIRKQFKAARAGAPGFYAFVFTEKNTLPETWKYYIIPMQEVIKWYYDPSERLPPFRKYFIHTGKYKEIEGKIDMNRLLKMSMVSRLSFQQWLTGKPELRKVKEQGKTKKNGGTYYESFSMRRSSFRSGKRKF